MDRSSSGMLKNFVAKKPVLICSAAAVFILSMILIKIDNLISGPSGMGVSYLQLAFSRESFLRIVSLWGDYGTDLFIKTVWLDYLYPVAYSVLIAGGLAAAEKKLKENGRSFTPLEEKIYLLPFTAAVADMIENSVEVYILLNKAYSDYIILTASIISSIKWFLIVISLVIFLKRYFSFRKIMKGEA